MNNEELVEEGIIIESAGGVADVALIKSDNCEDCSARLFCKPRSESMNILQARDPFGLSPGDEVKIAVDGNIVLKISAALYGLPLVLFVSGILAGMRIFAGFADKELLAFSLSAVSTAAYFLLFFVLSKRKTRRAYLPKIIFVKRKMPRIR